jgi:hypothetical protein
VTHDEREPDEPGITTPATTAAAGGPTRRPRWRRVAELVLPPVLAAGAVGVHWGLNVPEKIVESPNDQGSKAKKPDKDKNKKKKARERKPRDARRDEARTSEELDADWVRLGTVPFDEEPTRTAWARRNQAVINRAVVEARRQAFEGAPEDPNVVLTDTTCRTVRCRFLLRSPYPNELELMTAALERLEIAGEPAWRSYEVEPVEPAVDPERPEPKAQRAVQITVAFHTDDVDSDDLAIPPVADAEPADAEPNELDEPNEG